MPPYLKSKYRKAEYRANIQGDFKCISGEVVSVNKKSISDTLHHSGNDVFRIDMVNNLKSFVEQIDLRGQKLYLPDDQNLSIDGFYKVPFVFFEKTFWLVVGKKQKTYFVKCINNKL
jgi:hypothetical protein